MEVYGQIKELAAAVLERDEAPKPLVELCWRLVGSRLTTKEVPDAEACREAAIAQLSSKRGDHRVALRFDELTTSLTSSRAVGNVEALLTVLCEVSKGSRVVRGGLPLSSLNIEEEKKGSPAPEKPYTTMNKPPARASEARKEEDLNFVAPMNVGEGEEKLVRDVLWCLQGIDGKHCVFRSSDGTFAIDRRVCGRLAWLDRARELCELGWLYRKVSQYANSGDSVGLVEASLRSGLSDELAEYYRLIAVLEARLNRRQDAAHRLSLRRLTVWTLEPLERLKTMASLTDAISEARAHGGAILSILHARTKHGDPQVHDFLESLAQRTAEPMFAALRRWLFAGELAQDPHKEFFVFENEEETTTAAFWRDRYALRSEMVPSFIRGSEDQILLIGKALNFLKRCSDGAATTSPPPASSMEDLDDDDLAFRYNGEERLARLVRRVAVAVNGRIRTTLVEDFRLVDHLRTLRACLLLMQGDFAVRLVDAIEPHRAAAAGRRGSSSSSSHALGGAASVVRHNVWTAFDSAVRASNAVTLRTLDCLRVAIVRGRDDVVLDYEPPSPVDAVVDQEALAAYRAAHSVFLRRIRVEHQLSKAWRHHMTAKRVLSKNVVFHRTALARARIAQLVTALGAYYCSVVDDNWRRLEAIVDKDASGLDDIVEAHRSYLVAIETKALFKKRAPTEDDLEIAPLLDALLTTATVFCSLVEAVITDALSSDEVDESLAGRLESTIQDFDSTSRTLRTTLASATTDEAAAQLAYRLEYSC